MAEPVENKAPSKPRRYVPRSKRALYPDLVSDLPPPRPVPARPVVSRPDRTRPWVQQAAQRSTYAGVFVGPEPTYRPAENQWSNQQQRNLLSQRLQPAKAWAPQVRSQKSATQLPAGMIEVKTSKKKKKRKKKKEPKPKSELTLYQEHRARMNKERDDMFAPKQQKQTLWDRLQVTKAPKKKKIVAPQSWAQSLHWQPSEPDEKPVDALEVLKKASKRVRIEKSKEEVFQKKAKDSDTPARRNWTPKKNRKPTKLKLSIEDNRRRRAVKEVLEIMLRKLEVIMEERYYEDAFQPDERWRLGNTKWPTPTPSPSPEPTPPATPPPEEIPLDENGVPDVTQFVPVEPIEEKIPEPKPVKRVWGIVQGEEKSPAERPPLISFMELIRAEKEKAKAAILLPPSLPPEHEETPQDDEKEESIKPDEPECKSESEDKVEPEPEKPKFNPLWHPPKRKYKITVIRASENKKTAFAVLDPDEETSWISGTKSEKYPNQWLVFDFGRKAKIQGLSLMARREISVEGAVGVRELVLETSVDSHAWIKVGRFIADETVEHFQYFSLLPDVKQTSGRFARIIFAVEQLPVEIVRVEFHIGKDKRKIKLPAKHRSFQKVHCDSLMSQHLQEKIYRHYVRNMQSPELVEKVNHLLEKLIFFYRRAKERNPRRAKKRVICGMNEIRNKRDLLKGLLVATNIEYHSDSDRPGLNDLLKGLYATPAQCEPIADLQQSRVSQFQDITSGAEEDGIPVIYVGTLRTLAKAVQKSKGFVSAVGVLDIEGCRPTWKEICALAENLREERMMAEADYLPISNKMLKDFFLQQKLSNSLLPYERRPVRTKGADDVQKKFPTPLENPNSKSTAKS